MEAVSTPRVTCAYLNMYVGRNVMVVGKVQQLRGEEAVIDADGNITVHLNRDAHLAPGSGVQIIGKVNPDLSVKVLSSMDLGNSVDYTLANKFVEIEHQYPNLFIYPGEQKPQGF
ncbi:replication factor A protein 3 [Naviculisporaceae sp. PSN 640]